MRRQEIKWRVAALYVLSGTDKIAVTVGAFPLRVVYVVFLLEWLRGVRRTRYSPRYLACLILFVAAAACSLMQSPSLAKSFAYLLITIFSGIAVVGVSGRLASESPACLVKGLLLGGRLQLAGAVLLYLTGHQQRVSLLYYEPSYFAIALAPYFCAAIWLAFAKGPKRWLMDGGLIIGGLIATQSATYVMVIVVAFFSVAITLGSYRVAAQAALGLTGLAAVLLSIAYLANDRVALLTDAIQHTMQAGSLSDSLSYLALRGGNRLDRIVVAWQVFELHPWTGVGLGAYEIFMTLPQSADLWSSGPWDDVAGLPAINIYVELMASAGGPAAAAFVLLLAVAIWGHRDNTSQVVPLIRAMLLCMAVSLLFESSYLRPYFWFLIGAMLGANQLVRADPGADDRGTLARRRHSDDVGLGLPAGRNARDRSFS